MKQHAVGALLVRFLCSALLFFANAVFGQGLLPAGGQGVTSYLQQSNNTCGLGVLAYWINERAGITVDQSRLDEILATRYPLTMGKPPLAGYSLADMTFILKQYGADPRVFRASPKQLLGWLEAASARRSHSGTALNSDIILRLSNTGMPHYVALLGMSDEKARVFDPAVGILELPIAELLARWQEPSGTGLLLIPTMPVVG